ncbi:MAG TPA: MFS transporter [Acidobacteriota bacterium]|jgi:putative MFS transporter
MNIAGRLERLPVSKFHYRFITLISLGAWFDFYDIFMVAYLGAALHASGFFDLRQLSMFISSGFLGMFAGTIIFGMGSDYLGRRTAFVFMLLIYSVFTLAGAFAPSAFWLIASRALAGVGIGAELVVIDTYVTEMVPSAVRGRFIAITQVSGFLAVPVVAALSWLLVPTHFLLAGWRWVMVIGAMGALLAWYLRRSLTESPRWLESRGRVAEAERLVAGIERQIEQETGKPLPEPLQVTAESASTIPWLELWRGPYLKRTAMLIGFHFLQTIGIYGYANWLPTFLVQQGIPLVRSLGYTLLMALASPLGPVIAVWTIDRLERKWAITLLSSAIAVAGILFSQVRHPALVVLFGALITTLSYWFSAVLHTYQAELFPTRARATGVGFTYSWSRLSAALSSLVIGAMLAHGVFAVILLISAAWLGVAIIIGAFGPRTNAIPLELVSK